MGNSESKDQETPKSPGSKLSTPQPLRHKESGRKPLHNVSHAPTTKTSSAAPSAALGLVPSSSTASTSTSNTHAQATVSRSPASSHTRARSITSAAPRLRPEDSASSQKSDISAMGNAESRQNRPPSRSATLPAPGTPNEKQAVPSPSAQPVDVPQQPNDGLNEKEIFAPAGAPTEDFPYPPAMGSRYDRPPRLPLPIEEEVHTPGSPIITPQDLSSPVDQTEFDGVIPRRTSVLSSTTVDDEDVGDGDAFSAESNALAPTVPTPISWHGPGDKIYVTGTFVNWEKKFKLHRDKETGVFSSILQLKPGTHHIKFLVDGDMITSDDMPTTVDYTNILVNYIEVVAPLPSETQPPAPAEPMPIPGAAITAGQATGTAEAASRPLDSRSQTLAPETEADLPSTLQETVVQVRQQVPVQPASASSSTRPISTPTATPASHGARPAPTPKHKQIPRPTYTNTIPAFLTDLDATLASESDSRYQRAKRVEAHLPQPPTLPMFLMKSILNGTTPHKDDASVLVIPNHTVLNHLATSSIKHGVLATSGTTRYKRKFLTTIMYKPTSSDDG